MAGQGQVSLVGKSNNLASIIFSMELLHFFQLLDDFFSLFVCPLLSIVAQPSRL
ncbi:hypothetical protein [Desulfopila sp. IMCC35008]|uniref:hypothetical protein n=1 Tax=Desulfopila sp. IMCC35008 TaxID=2653858 RepID=UPI0013D1DD3D|nr:hypothetical protein [Desulfopila sp. IMCC35008]